MSERTTYIPPEAIGLTEEQMNDREMMEGALGEGKETWEHFTPEFVGTKVSTISLGDIEKQIYTAQKNFETARISQLEGSIELKTDLPVSIFFIGDVHYGSVDADIQTFARNMDEIARTPNAYMVFMGNLIDNGMPGQFPDNMLTNAITPDKQVLAMRKIVTELSNRGKILGAVTSPCHEGWTWKKTGQDVNALIFGFDERRFPILENGGKLHIALPGANYEMALFHQVGPYESNFNETHALRQLNRLVLGMKADIVAGGHKHCAAAELAYEGDGKERHPVAYVRSGTYKGIGNIRDQFSIGRYGSTGEPSGQSVILWPNEKKMDVNLEFSTGILAHESIYIHEMIKRDRVKK